MINLVTLFVLGAYSVVVVTVITQVNPDELTRSIREDILRIS